MDGHPRAHLAGDRAAQRLPQGVTFYHLCVSPKANKGLFPKILVSNVKKLPIKYEPAFESPIVERVKILLVQYSGRIDNEIDQLVYELYGLTQDEISIVEQSAM